MGKGALVVRFVGDMRDLDRTTVKVSKNMSGLGKLGTGLAVGVGALVAGVGALAVSTTKDLIRVERLGKQTEAIIKATGGAAGRSKKQVDAMADRLELMTGVEREAVTEGQNMLLTFKNIKGKTFDSATKAALDMGVAMNKGSLEGLDLQATSIRLGKALNDPVKGISALSKVGVSFTEQQKKQIKAMTEAGNVAGAQGVILKELKGEFGGAAKAAGMTTEGMWAKMKNTFGNISEGVMQGVLPVLLKVGTWVNTKVMPALARFGGWLRTDGMPALKVFGGWLKTNVLPPLKSFGGFIANDLVPALVSMGRWVGRNKDWLSALGVVFGVLTVGIGAYKLAIFTAGKAQLAWAGITKGVAAAQMVLNAVLSANPVGLVILAIAALTAGLVFFFTKTKTGQKIVKAVWGGIQAAIKGVSEWWTKTAYPALQKTVSALGDGFRLFGRVARAVWSAVSDALGTAARWIKREVFDRIALGLFVMRYAFNLARTKVIAAFSAISDRLGSIGSWVRRHVFSPIVTFVTTNIPNGFRNARDKVAGFFGGMRDRLRTVGTWIRTNVFGKIRSALTVMKDAFRNARDGISRIWDGLKRAAARPVNFLIKWVWNNGLRKVLNAIPGVNLPEVKPVKFASGGAVRGGTPGRDSVRALMMPGEHVWTTKEVAAAGGHGQMRRMRQAVLKGNLNGDPKFAKGGSLSGDAIARAQAFARRQSGRPYGWGAVGPNAYDCSGFMSALTNVLQGQSPHRRRGATGDFPWPGFKRGTGQFTIGSTPNYRGSGVGHMVGNLAGMGVESRGGTGVIIGSGAMSTGNPAFGQQYHLGAAGKAGAGNWWDNIAKFVRAMQKLPSQIQEIMSGGSWISSFLKRMVVGVSASVARFVNNKIPDIGPIKTNPLKPIKLAAGGVVRHRPGGVPAIIGEGRYDEAVIPLPPGHGTGGGGTGQTVYWDPGDEFVKIIRKRVADGGGDVQVVLGKGPRR